MERQFFGSGMGYGGYPVTAWGMAVMVVRYG